MPFVNVKATGDGVTRARKPRIVARLTRPPLQARPGKTGVTCVTHVVTNAR